MHSWYKLFKLLPVGNYSAKAVFAIHVMVIKSKPVWEIPSD